MAFLDEKHDKDWAIWEFRAEGTGYPDEEVYNRVRHYPFPDHHPPPFRLVPMMLASMRNWLHGGALEGGRVDRGENGELHITTDIRDSTGAPITIDGVEKGQRKKERVVVVHCKAGKGRSGTASCSYLIAEEGWTKEDALKQFTARRMRPGFGNGVSIPSQVRWVGYVDRWANKGQKKYRDQSVEVTEIHVWGLRTGVKVEIAGFANEGKQIKVLHTFKKSEREVIEGNPPDSSFSDAVWEMAGYPPKKEADDKLTESDDTGHKDKRKSFIKRQGTSLIEKLSSPTGHEKLDKVKSKTISELTPGAPSSESEPGGMAVVLRPTQPVLISGCDINISVERRNNSSKALGLTMVSSVAHVWFNTFFEGGGPEQEGQPDNSGVFSIDWEAMDGIKGSSRKGTKAFDKMSVVWRASKDSSKGSGEEVLEPKTGQHIPDSKAADWHGDDTGEKEKDLGLRVTSPGSEGVSKASSIKSEAIKTDKDDNSQPHSLDDGEDGESLKGVKSGGPDGVEFVKEATSGKE